MTAEPTLLQTPEPAERAAAYRWLAGLLAREIAAEAVDIYRTADGQALLAGLRDLPGLAPLVEALDAQIAVDAPPGSVANTLAGAYARLFHGVGGRRAAPPCASFYLSETGRMMQREAAATRAGLDELDMRLAEEMREPPDHVAVQLAVMAHLCETAEEAVQGAWLETRLTPWLGAFAVRCESAGRPCLYAFAARAAADFCAADLTMLNLPTGSPRPLPRASLPHLPPHSGAG